MPNDADPIITVASIIAGFGVAVLMFRLQRELAISDKNWQAQELDPKAELPPTWLALADLMVIAAILIALLLVILPLLINLPAGGLVRPRAWCAVATVLLAGYVPSILAHYNFLYGLHRSRPNVTFWEITFVVVTLIGAWFVFSAIGAS